MCELLNFWRLSNDGLFTSAASSACGVGGGDVKCCQLRGTRGYRGQKRLAPALSSQPIPLFDPSKRHPPSPNALCHLGLVDVVHQVRERPRVPPPPGVGWPLLAGGVRNRQAQWTFTLARPVWVHPGDVHFSQDHCPPPHPTSHALNDTNGPKWV